MPGSGDEGPPCQTGTISGAAEYTDVSKGECCISLGGRKECMTMMLRNGGRPVWGRRQVHRDCAGVSDYVNCCGLRGQIDGEDVDDLIFGNTGVRPSER